MSIRVRQATPPDVPTIVRFIRELAEYEKLLHECATREDELARHLFSERPIIEAVVGEIDSIPQGFALFFTNFSTFVCKPGIYLEDLYVTPDARGKGLGKALLTHLARECVRRGYGRLEWSVLDWNTPAIDFYRSLGAVPMSDWTVMRVSGSSLTRLGSAIEPNAR